MSGANWGERRDTDDVGNLEAMVAGGFWFEGTETFQSSRVVSPFLQAVRHIGVKQRKFKLLG